RLPACDFPQNCEKSCRSSEPKSPQSISSRWSRNCHAFRRSAHLGGDASEIFRNGKMFRITWDKNGEFVVNVCGRMDGENLSELRALFSSEGKGRRIVLNLIELTLVDQDAVRFLERCEADGIELRNCPTYIRKWITRERRADRAER